jgi:hypothetical protein
MFGGEHKQTDIAQSAIFTTWINARKPILSRDPF